MLTLVVRDLDLESAGTATRTQASDPNNPVVLCRAEQGWNAHQTGTCTISMGFWGVLVFLKFGRFSCERAETGSLGPTESGSFE